MFQFLVVTIILLLLLLGTISGQVVCPEPAAYSPCDCTKYTGSEEFLFTTSTLDCSNRNLNDSNLNEILNAFTSNPLVSPINRLVLYSNQLTRVPEQITQLRWLTFVNLNANQIPSVKLAAFNFTTEKLNIIDLSENDISNIKPAAFQGIAINQITIFHFIATFNISGIYINYSKIFLDKNKLTRFESDVFQSVLEQMAPHPEFPGSFVSIGNSRRNL